MKTQKELFEALTARFGSRNEMCREVGLRLSVSADTVSKWGYGNIMLSYDRLQKLVKLFELGSEDVFHSRPDLITFVYKPLNMDDMEGYRNYIEGFNQIHQKLVDMPDVFISFHADDIPIYHLMSFKLLTYFKLYSFASDVQQLAVPFEEFVERMQSYGLEPIFEQIVSCYERIPSIEVWDEWVMDTLLYQIEHFDILERYVHPHTRIAILEELKALLERFQTMARNGVKPSGVRFDFYRRHSPSKKGYMLLHGDGKTRLSIKVDTINSMSAHNPNIVHGFATAFQATVNKSTAVGVGAERERTMYFRSLRAKIERALGYKTS